MRSPAVSATLATPPPPAPAPMPKKRKTSRQKISQYAHAGEVRNLPVEQVAGSIGWNCHFS